MLLTLGEGWGSTPSSLEQDDDEVSSTELVEMHAFLGVLVTGGGGTDEGDSPFAAAPSSNVNSFVFIGFFSP